MTGCLTQQIARRSDGWRVSSARSVPRRPDERHRYAEVDRVDCVRIVQSWRNRRYGWAYLFGAVCPERAVGAGLVLPYVNAEAMSLHLQEISRHVTPGAHAVLVLDGAGWHGAAALTIPDNISLLPLPSYSPELNPVENVWEYLRQNQLSLRIWPAHQAIVETCCQA